MEFVSSSPWTYGIVFSIAALDAFFPVVPSETVVITAGVLSATGNLFVPVVIAAGAMGAVLGDHVSYGGGRLLGERIADRFFTGERRKRLDWAQRQLDERGGYLIIIGRFIPGGRTAVTFSSGLLRMHWRRFLAWDVAAGAIWATYAALLGFFGGRAFEESPWKGLLLAFGIAVLVSALIEAYRWLRRRGALASG